MKSATSRCLLLLAVASCFLLSVAHAPHQLLERQLTVSAPPVGATTTTPTSTPPPTTPTTTTPQTTPTTTPTSTPPTTSPTQTTNTPSSTPTTTQATSTPPSQTTATPTVTPTTAPLPLSTSVQTTTNAAGEVLTSTVVITPTASASASSTQLSPTSSSSSSSSGLGTGSIVGLSVAGGVAVIGIISFFIWKFTRKRFADFDDNEAIKWPELNTHSSDIHALPTKSTGRSGFGAENDSEMNLARAPSPGGYAHSVAANSLPETYISSPDPYAVPPLPHLNPNQPYHDDPGTYGQADYYDPYRGPVPNTFGDGFSDGHTAETIQMTRMARTRSPGPQMGYDVQGRASPGPQAAMGYALDGRSASPAIGAGRASPGPQAAYGYGPR
ncbi:uncharacterized protein EDB93DRAFT_1241810 [Suillus bovinus]|uniref:uncharacterized protein n=1 Tax=Suillus bovinus TaxID=48563 RepID=UPI001B869A5B|nr:uncharacterized protein EDB93DRAFT_1241810 [Suillus bovinus]KAG2141170.1 hypothetical protein EDB93DRAFT_1241810 [Suillus bovinus]